MQGKLTLAGLAVSAGYVALSGGASGPAASFAAPAAKAIERLKAKERVVNGTGMGSLTIDSAGMHDGALLIRIARAGDPHRVKCRVTVSAVSPQESRSAVDCSQPGGTSAMRRVGIQALDVIVREHVAATIEKRAYDTDRVADSMIGLVVTSRPAIAGELARQAK